MTRRQKTSLIKSSKPYLVNTRKIKRDVDLTPIYKMIENSAKSPSTSADEQLGFSGQSADKKHFLLTKIVLLQILILTCYLSGCTMRIAGQFFVTLNLILLV